jgi:hypothetical protein
MIVRNPEDLKDEVLLRLGAPVVSIEVTCDQIMSCIDRGMEMYVDYHYDGVSEVYLMVKADAMAARTGYFKMPVTCEAVSEIVKTNDSWMGLNLAALGVTSLSSPAMVNGFNGLVNLAPGNFALSSYEMANNYYDMFEKYFNTDRSFVYNSDRQLLKIRGGIVEGQVFWIKTYMASLTFAELTKVTRNDIGQDALGQSLLGIGEDQFDRRLVDVSEPPSDLAIDAALTATIDDNASGIESEFLYSPQSAYNNRWLKDYVTALTKAQWATNLKKFSGATLPGGVQFDTKELYAEAKEEIAELREELMAISPPLDFYFG